MMMDPQQKGDDNSHPNGVYDGQANIEGIYRGRVKDRH